MRESNQAGSALRIHPAAEEEPLLDRLINGPISAAEDRLSTLCARLNIMHDRLLGAEPEATSATEPNFGEPKDVCVLDRLNRKLRSIHDLIERIDIRVQALNRL